MNEIKLNTDRNNLCSYNLDMGYDWVVNDEDESFPSWLSLKEGAKVETINIEYNNKRFYPAGIVFDSEKNMFLADRDSHRILRVSRQGTSIGYEDPSLSGFSYPTSMVMDKDDNLIVVDSANDRILKIFSSMKEKKKVGNGYGFRDGTTSQAQFKKPSSVFIDTNGDYIVADTNNHRIRKITKDFSMVSTLAGGSAGFRDGDVGVAKFKFPSDITMDKEGNIIVADSDNNKIRKISKDFRTVSTIAGSNEGFKDAVGVLAKFDYPTSVTVDDNHNIWVADSQNNRIRKLTLDTKVTTIVGHNEFDIDFKFNTPLKVVPFTKKVSISEKGIIVLDKSRDRINKIRTQYKLTGIPSVAGDYVVSLKRSDGKLYKVNISVKINESFEVLKEISNRVQPSSKTKLTEKKLNVIEPKLNDIDSSNLDSYNQYLVRNKSKFSKPAKQAEVQRMIDSVNSVEVLKKPVSMKEGISYKQLVGKKKNTSFLNWSVTEGYPLPSWLNLVQRVEVSSIAGGSQGFKDGKGHMVEFSKPSGVAFDREGNIIVADRDNNKIRKITLEGEVSTIAGSTRGFKDGNINEAEFTSPSSVVIDSKGNIIVADRDNHKIRKITVEGVLSTIAGSEKGFEDGEKNRAKFASPTGIALDSRGNIIVADQGNHKIRKITPEGMVSTIAGSRKGFKDGDVNEAEFCYPRGVAIDSKGNIIVADTDNNSIRKITLEGMVSTITGRESTRGAIDGDVNKAQFYHPSAVVIDSRGDIIVMDAANYKLRKITSKGMVSTIAGTTHGLKDGEAKAAKFDTVYGIAIDSGDNIIVAATRNSRVRTVIKDYTLVGKAPKAGSYDISLTLNDGMESTVHKITFVVKANEK